MNSTPIFTDICYFSGLKPSDINYYKYIAKLLQKAIYSQISLQIFSAWHLEWLPILEEGKRNNLCHHYH